MALWSSVCGDGWTSAWSDLVCEQIEGGTSVSTEVRRIKPAAANDNGVVVPRPRVSLAPDASARSRTPLQYALSHDKCSSDALVHLKCLHEGKLYLEREVHPETNLHPLGSFFF